MRVGEVGLDANRLATGRDRIVKAFKFSVSDAELHIGFGKFRVVAQQLFIGFDGVFGGDQVRISRAEVVMRVNKSGFTRIAS